MTQNTTFSLRGSTLLRWLLLFPVTVLVCLSALLYLGLTAIPYFQQDINRYLSQQLGSEVKINQLQTYWKGLSAHIALSDIELPETGNAQAIDKLHLSLDLGRILSGQSNLPLSLQIEGLKLSLQQQQTGEYQLTGLSLPRARTADEVSISWSEISYYLSHKRLVLGNSQINLSKQNSPDSLAIKDINLSLDTSNQHITFDAHWQPPAKVGRAGSIKLNTKGALNSPEHWQGHIAVNIPEAQLKPLLPWLPVKNTLDAYQLSSQLQFESRWQGQHIEYSEGAINITLELPDKTKLTLHSDIQLTTAAPGYSLQLPLYLRYKNTSLENQIEFDITSISPLQFVSRTEALDLEAISHFALGLPLLSQQHQQKLATLEPRGLLKNIAMTFAADSGLEARAQIENLGINAVDQLPAFSKLNTQLHFSKGKLLAEIDSPQLVFNSNGLFREPFQFTRFKTALSVYQENSDWWLTAPQIDLALPEAEALANFSMRFEKGKKPWLKVTADATNGEAGRAGIFYPTRVMKDSLVAYLDQAIRSGKVSKASCHIEGYVDQYFKQGRTGIFLIDADIEDLEYNYLPGWPALNNARVHFHMDGPGIDITVKEAHSYSFTAEEGRVLIPDVLSGELFVDVPKARGDLGDGLRFLKESRLNETTAVVNQLIPEASQAVDISLSLYTPLSDKLKHKATQYKVGIDFHNNQLALSTLDLQVGKLSGQLTIEDNRLNSQDLQGQLNQTAPFTLKINTLEQAQGNRLQLNASTRARPIDLLKDNLGSLTQFIEGESEINLSLDSPLSSGQSEGVAIVVQSQLNPLHIKLPPPLYKAKGVDSQLRLDIAPQEQQTRIKLSMGEHLKGLINLRDEHLAASLNWQRGWPRPSAIPSTGINIHAQLDTLTVDPWLDYLQQLQNQATETKSSQSPFREIKLDAQAIRYSDYQLSEQALVITPDSDAWKLTFNSPTLQGSARFPNASTAPWELDFSRFDLSQLTLITSDSSASGELKPVDIPAMNIQLQQVAYQHYRFDELTGLLRPQAHGLEITNLNGRIGSSNSQGKLEWTYHNGEHNTRIQLATETTDLGLLAEQLEPEQNYLTDGNGAFSLDLNWHGPPHAANLATLSGQGQLGFSDGEFTELNSGAARVLSLLSVNSLPKRLFGNFKSITDQGLQYDRFEGDVEVRNGQVFSDNLMIEADFGRLGIRGRTGLVTRDYDQYISVTPELSGTLTLTAGLLTGGIGAAGTLLLDQAVSLFGGDLDKIAELNFHLTGDWSNPDVEQMKPRMFSDLSDEELKAQVMEAMEKMEQKPPAQQR